MIAPCHRHDRLARHFVGIIRFCAIFLSPGQRNSAYGKFVASNGTPARHLNPKFVKVPAAGDQSVIAGSNPTAICEVIEQTSMAGESGCDTVRPGAPAHADQPEQFYSIPSLTDWSDCF